MNQIYGVEIAFSCLLCILVILTKLTKLEATGEIVHMTITLNLSMLCNYVYNILH